ncbi:MFS transporter [Streptomyces sp. NPDC014773]|uniref:MFS transporter n=1 Tax=Streptomyces sp. NPDC014773 TaxID=3364908 RepID=UPI0036F967AB
MTTTPALATDRTRLRLRPRLQPRPRPRTGEGAERRRGLLLAALAAPAAAGVSGPALVVPQAAASLGVSAGAAAWLLTVFGIGMAAGTPLLAAAGRRRGPGGTLRVAAGLVLAGAAVVAVAPGFAGALAGRALLAAGAAGFNVAAFQLAGRDGSGRSAGLVAIGSAAGGTAGLFGGAAVAAAVDWRAALVLPLLSLAALVPVLRDAAATRPTGPQAPAPEATGATEATKATETTETRVPEPSGTRNGGGGTRRILASAPFLAAAGLMLALSTVNFGLMYAGPARVAALTGWGPVPIGAYAALAALAGALTSWGLVRLGPRLGAARVRAVLAAGAVLAVALAAGPWAWPVLLGTAVSSLATAGGQGLLTGASAAGLPESLRDSAVGLFNLAFLTGVAVGPALAAALL